MKQSPDVTPLIFLGRHRSARANPRRYEIPVRMCLGWLVVRPLASIKLTTELLLVMPDILTAPGGADTRVFEGKTHSPGSHTRAPACVQTHTHRHCAVSSNSVSNSKQEGTVEQTKDGEWELLPYCFLCFCDSLRD